MLPVSGDCSSLGNKTKQKTKLLLPPTKEGERSSLKMASGNLGRESEPVSSDLPTWLESLGLIPGIWDSYGKVFGDQSEGTVFLRCHT